MTTMSVVGECFFWYRLTRVVPDNFHRAVKRLCVCWRRISLKSDVVCQSYSNVFRGTVFSWTRCMCMDCRCFTFKSQRQKRCAQTMIIYLHLHVEFCRLCHAASSLLCHHSAMFVVADVRLPGASTTNL